MKILMISGVKDAKADKLIKTLHDKISKDVEIVNVNKFIRDYKEAIETEKPDVVIALDKEKREIDLPFVEALALVYPQMGFDKTIAAIKEKLGL